MYEVSLESLGKNYEDATIQSWLLEEGDVVEKGEDLVELITSDGVITLQSPASGILSEVYYDEGELVSQDELLCVIDEND